MPVQIKTASLGRGLGWLSEGLGYFTKNPLGWIAAMIVVFIIMIVVGVIPLGSLLMYLLYPVFAGGFMLGCQAHANGQQFEFQHAFAGFSAQHLKRLVLFGLLYGVMNIIMLIILLIVVFLMMGGIEFFQQLQTMQPEDIARLGSEMAVVFLLASLLFLPIIMVSWFAPALIVTTDCRVVEAMILSFKSCLFNVPAFTLYGFVVFVLGILAAIPFGLGYLVFMPVLTASVYVAFLDCFTLDDTENESTAVLNTVIGDEHGPD